MSSTYTKLIKDATKAKPGAPKPKYIDPILAATFSQDGSLADVCRSLALRLRESNSIVVFKSLLIIHTMIRNGAVDNVLSHLSADQAGLKLKNVSQGGNWQGYDAAPSLSPYAAYLDERIRAFRELKHDVIRSAEGSSRSRSNGDGANRLRRLRVERGLLREVGFSQRVLSRLLDCSFFHDNLSDDLNLSAFRMVLKDVLALYTAINEGVINILEHYFEMSHSDASKALDVYKRFCRHTEKVVAYLSAARKASHSLNMTVPQLKHAPVSLAGALEEYLNDPAFEKNRTEYQENKRIADGGGPRSTSSPPVAPAASAAKSPTKSTPANASSATTARKVSIQEPSAEEKTRPTRPPTNNQAIQDFFSTLESENGPESSGAFGNAFSMAPQATGMAWFGSPNPAMGGGAGFGDMGMQPQMTGYNPFTMMPQQTGMPSFQDGFPQQQQQQQQPAFLQSQATAMPSIGHGAFLAPQQTGYNPFRQSMMPQQTGFVGNGGGAMVPQVTGIGPGGAFDATPFTQQVQQQLAMQRMQKQQQEQNGSKAGQQQENEETDGGMPSASTLSPSSHQQPQASPMPKPIFAQKTGSRNPFAPAPGEKPPTPPPAVPKGPSLAELAFGSGSGLNGPTQSGGGGYSLGAGGWTGTANVASANGSAGTQGTDSQQQQQGRSSSGLFPQKTGLLGSVASEFTSAGRGKSGLNSASPIPQQPLSSPSFGMSQPTTPAIPNGTGGPGSSLSAEFSSLSVSGGIGSSSRFPSNTNTEMPFSSPSALQPQATGFAGSAVKPFKPESSFGAELASQYTGLPSQQHSVGSGNPFGLSAGQSQAQGTGGGAGGYGSTLFGNTPSNGAVNSPSLNAQPTGFNSAFASAFSPSASAQAGGGGAIASQPTGFASSMVKPFQPTSAFGSSTFGGAIPSTSGQQQQQQQQQGQGGAQTGSFF